MEATPAQAIAFLMPNNPCHEPLSAYAVSVDYIEEKVGIDFWPGLADSLENTLEANYNFSAWSSRKETKLKSIKTIPASQQPKGSFASTEAKNHYGQQATICGIVASTFKNKKGKI